jgi:hypothetical protein
MSTSVGKAAPYATVRPALVKQRGNERGILRHSDWDAPLILLAVTHAALVISFPYFPIIAIGLWWNSNTIAHYFIHRPFFRPPTLNRGFSLFQSALLGVPQTLWRDRHLAHHAGIDWRFRFTALLAAEMTLILLIWVLLLLFDPRFFLMTYVPAYFVGLGLCWIHGHYEHSRGTVSHYGRLYNSLFLNDGYHIEHHAHPTEHWTRLPRWRNNNTASCSWPAVLRWLDFSILEWLERFVIRSAVLQRFVLVRHQDAFQRLLPELMSANKVAIVGGGLFPRTLLILQRLMPNARFVVIDRCADNIEQARSLIDSDTNFIHAPYSLDLVEGMDLVVIPLSFVGDREEIYRNPPARHLVIHDWLWRPRGVTTVVSIFLLKRLNLVRQ